MDDLNNVFVPIFKCRLCGEMYLKREDTHKWLYQDDDCEPIAKIDIHKCGQDRIGIADLLGYDIEEEEF